MIHTLAWNEKPGRIEIKHHICKPHLLYYGSSSDETNRAVIWYDLYNVTSLMVRVFRSLGCYCEMAVRLSNSYSYQFSRTIHVSNFSNTIKITNYHIINIVIQMYGYIRKYAWVVIFVICKYYIPFKIETVTLSRLQRISVHIIRCLAGE